MWKGPPPYQETSLEKNYPPAKSFFSSLWLKLFLHYICILLVLYVWLRNRSKSAGLKPVLSHTEKSCTVSYYIQFSTNIKMYKHNIKTSFIIPCLPHLGANNTGLIFYLYIFISTESCLWYNAIYNYFFANRL